MDSFESSKDAKRRLSRFRLRQIEFRNFVARRRTSVLDRAGHDQRLAGHDCGWDFQIAVRESRVAETVPEAVQRLAIKVTVGAALHRVIFEARDLAERRVER